ncbi:hypothetical protein F3Y22_tig00011718pilonHSYRG00075 [Hibiscus syriacus]|uniref:Uncharacterized protein n=1 Tax=Hibiscus syriacus TaxID=106335 RepID=A0A6A3C9G3_HIBSY|nr:hypothetical protein F3Y22_tig00011718pilonHSYRG00075 [Hibiscus syriacus]
MPRLLDGVVESSQQLYVDLQTTELWNSSIEDSTHLESLKTKWNPTLAKINNIVKKKASDGDSETVNTLLRSSYNFYWESSCAMLPSVINLSLVPSRLLKENQFPSSIEGVEPLELSISRKLLSWAYTLLNGRYAGISAVVKYSAASYKEAASHGGGSEAEAVAVISGPPVVVSESDNRHSTSLLPSSSEGQRSLLMAPQRLYYNDEEERERSSVASHGGGLTCVTCHPFGPQSVDSGVLPFTVR